jgi:hypothetical protein
MGASTLPFAWEIGGGIPSRTRNEDRALSAARLDLTRLSPHHPGTNRRRFLLGSLAGVLAAPRAAEAQQAERVHRRLAVGWFSGTGCGRRCQAALH